jgi:hypothetical protein
MRVARFERLDRERPAEALPAARSVVLVAGVAVALVLVGLATQSRPWTEGVNPGTIPNGWLAVVTALAVLVSMLVLAAGFFLLWAVLRGTIVLRRDDEDQLVHEPPPSTLLERLVVYGVALVLVAAPVTGVVFLALHYRQGGTSGPPPQQTLPTAPPGGHGSSTEPSAGPGLNWDVLIGGLAAVVLGTLAFVGFTRMRRRPRPVAAPRPAATEELVAAIDESVDDLRADPDARRAVIRAYARMERALSQHGLARRSAEAPVEYLSRVLAQLRGSGTSARRLTELFSRAKFSQHPVGPDMRDEAIEALTGLRAELEAPS